MCALGGGTCSNCLPGTGSMCTNKASLYPSSSLSTGHIHAWHLDLLVAADAKLGPAAAGVCEVIIQPRGLPLLHL